MGLSSIQDFIKIYDNVFSEQYCNFLINYIDSGIDSRNAKFIDHELKPKFYEYVFEESMVQECISKLNPFLDKYVDQVECDEWLPQNYTYEYPRVKKYRQNTTDQFDTHVDVGNYPSARRFLTFLIYLNTVDKGGETCFTGIDRFIRPKRGRMIVFPPLWMIPHRGNPTIGEDKYILSTYLHYL
jgi:prolyl 4-hydroxylase